MTYKKVLDLMLSTAIDAATTTTENKFSGDI